MKKPMLILMLTLIAAIGLSGAASAQLIAFNLTIGNGTSILSPSQNQTQDQAQAQAQTSNNTNTNTLTNDNVNVAVSESEATNTNNISNNNEFNPVIAIENENEIGDISVRSTNVNTQAQLRNVKIAVKKVRGIV